MLTNLNTNVDVGITLHSEVLDEVNKQSIRKTILVTNHYYLTKKELAKLPKRFSVKNGEANKKGEVEEIVEDRKDSVFIILPCLSSSAALLKLEK